MRTTKTHFTPILILFLICIPIISFAQTIQVGSGSYTTVIPAGETGPPVAPKVSASFNQRIQTNDFWSSLIFPFSGNPHSNKIYAHPLTFLAGSNGLAMRYTSESRSIHHAHGQDFLFSWEAHHQPHLTVGVSGLSANQTLTHGYGDWTVTALWVDGSISMEATLGHGLPYTYFKINGGDAIVSTEQTPNVWYQQNEILALTIEGKHYALFAPTGSSWSGTSTFQSSLNGKGFLSVALLPDNELETLELFRSRAYAFVTDSRVDWTYDETNALLANTYQYETILMDSAANNVDETLTALYRHQWLNSSDVGTGHSYESPRGKMKLLAGNSFSTELTFNGMLPALPDRGDYNPATLLNHVQSAADESLPVGPTYENGKAMARFAHLVHIADQINAIEARDTLLSKLKFRLEDWFAAGGEQQYVYNSTWDVLTGYPSGFGADDQINDHHFHAAYAIMSAATIAQYDSAWASQENWGGMVNLLIKDANNWLRDDSEYPFLRSYDAYAGHSWAAGHADFAEGNNQESSSESMNFAAATFLWGEVTNQRDIRDLGVFLHTTEITAVEQYWFDVDDQVFPEDYPHTAIGMVWGGKGVHATWFGGDPEFIHGINILPITSSSLYLGRHPDYVLANYNEVVTERNGQPTKWKDLFWRYLALSDPSLALSYYYADPDDEPYWDEYFNGESKANTLHWLYNLKKMGHMDTSIVADIATYSVFRDKNNDLTYVAYNARPTERIVNFSDGYSMTVPPRQLFSHSTAISDPEAPVVSLVADKTRGKTPLAVTFTGSNSFDRNGSPLRYHWDFGDGSTAAVADTTYTFHEVGTHMVRLEVTNGLSLTAMDSIEITVLGNGTPYFGSPVIVPGRIEAKNYDIGGEGIAYHDVDANNAGLAYRPDEGVDLSGDGGAIHVYWIVAGEWIEYTFEVQEDGDYVFTPYVATVPGFGNFTLFIDNVDVSGKKQVLGTGSFINWQPIEIEAVPLEAGVHIMRFEFDTDHDSEKSNWLFSLNYTDVSKVVATQDDLNRLPRESMLSENYPNPFNPSTRINYQLHEASVVILSVYDINGRLIRKLRDAQQPAGYYSMQWNGLDDSGAQVSTGVYLCRMVAGEYSKTIKMVYLR